MAITYSNRIGYVRKRLAKLLTATFPGYTFEPENLRSNNPIFASPLFDCCSWDGHGKKAGSDKITISVYSYDTMRACLKGIDVSPEREDRFTFEISAKRTTPNPEEA